jgi:hypothetical protein
VTVFSQQIRALNLVWALIETELIPSGSPMPVAPRRKVGIVGGGFSGLTVAAGLLKKQAHAAITIFEQRDTLLPLQQGSDSRWLHPHIYDWPSEGSEPSVAMLPVLNWSAARASDVVVQILTEWKQTLTEWKNLALKHTPGPVLYCNARHLQIHETQTRNGLQIEWVGERRDPTDGTTLKEAGTAIGKSATFDIVILAVGFGLERDDARSYWRNETVGQPSLDQPRRTYLVSGQGDGAMIDLLRLRISQYRQDRFLEELFRGKPRLLESIKKIHEDYASNVHKLGLFDALELLAGNTDHEREFDEVRKELSRRLRRDTEVILRLQVRKLSDLFDPTTTRISFQNKLLVYLLYKCGGFFPSSQEEELLVRQHSIPPEQIIRRHGTLRAELLKGMLSDVLYAAIEKRRGRAVPDPLSQSDKMLWSGGYFGLAGPSKAAVSADDAVRENWRKEYLPGATALLATAFCSSLAGAVRSTHREEGRLRITLHRAIEVGNEELLQQTCEYFGTEDAKGSGSAGRTFPARNATIGLAYRCRRIVRSLPGIKPEDLISSMGLLSLNTASRTMSGDVGFVLAIPILEPEERRCFRAPSPLAGVVYIDSNAKGFFIDDKELNGIVSIISHFLYGLERTPLNTFDRLRNVPLTPLGSNVPLAESLPDKVRHVLELVSKVAPPKTSGPFQLNFDNSDFVPVQ